MNARPLIALAALMIAGRAEAAPGERYLCTVRDFIVATVSQEDQREFIAANKRKAFSILQTGSSFTVTSTSPDFQPSSTDYSLISDGGLYAIARARTGSFGETLVLSRNPMRSRPSHYEASISFQAGSFVNTWLLLCSKV